MDLSEIKRALEEQGRAWEDFKSANDALIKAKADGKAVGDLEAKVATLSGVLDKCDEKLSAIDLRVGRLAAMGSESKGAEDLALEVKSFNDARRAIRPNGAVADMDLDGFKAYKSAFISLVRNGKDSLSGDEVKVLQAGVDPDGGFLLPPAVIGRIVTRIYEQSPFRQVASAQTISTNDMEGLEDLDEAGAGVWLGETTAPTETGTPQVGKWRIEAYEYAVEPRTTQRILEDAAVNVEAWLAGKVADRIARVEGDAFINGSGVARPRGLCTYSTAATPDASRAWGIFEHVNTGAASALKADNAQPFDCFIDLQTALKPEYQSRARWYTRREVTNLMRKVKRSDYEYMWQPSVVAGQPPTFMGVPVMIDQYMPALGNGSLSLAFGDFATCYQIVDRLGLTTVRDALTAKPYVKFYTRKRVGGGAINFEAVKFLRFATA